MKQVKCQVCGGICIKYGKNKSGSQRWFCKQCGAINTPKIDNSTKQLEIFLDWLFGKQTQREMPGEGRTFRRKTSKFWDLWSLPPVEDIKAFAEGFGYDLSFTIDEIRPSYYHVESCQESVPQGIKCFLESTDFEQCIRLTISLGGDCDTTAAMSGAIAEAYYGIPEWMKERAFTYLPDPMLMQYARFENIMELGGRI